MAKTRVERPCCKRNLDPILGLEGHALTEVVTGFNDIRGAVESIAGMSKRMDDFMDQHKQELHHWREFNDNLLSELKQLVQYIVGGKNTIDIRELPHDETKKEVLALFRATDGPLYYSDVCEQLRLDLEQVLVVATELEAEGLIGEISRCGEPSQEIE